LSGLRVVLLLVDRFFQLGDDLVEQSLGETQDNPSFKGYAIPAATPIGLCEPTAHTSGSPQLDSSCWTSKPGNSKPPATLSAYIGVIVSTSIAKQGSSIYGNIAALVVVQVDPSSPYGSDPGHPGYGTIAAVIQDGASLFPHAAPRRALAPAGETSASPQTGSGEVIANSAPGQSVAPAAVATGNRRFFFYSSELHLLAESELTTSASPAILTEYIWFNGHPVAQSDTSGTTSWTFTDHLGTPFLQTSAAQGVTWRAEYEPYGSVFTLRSSDQHQPLRLPGQEAQQLGVGANGVSSRYYNIYRWFENGTGRYDQPDPLGLDADVNLYAYALEDPLDLADPFGLLVQLYCAPTGAGGENRVRKAIGALGFGHCFVRAKCDCPTYDKRLEVTGSSHGMAVIPKDPPDFNMANHAQRAAILPPDNSTQDCTKADCVRKKYDELRQRGYKYPAPSGYISGPNSNTFAAELLTSCGFTQIMWPAGIPPFTE
jgi:RHS repeat-associated protein